MKLQFPKVTLLVLITTHLLSCDAVKRVPENEHLLTDNTVFINGKKDQTELINNLLYQEPNSKIPIIGTPLRLHIYNLARNNRDSLFEAWLDKNPNRRERLTKRLSKKQLDKLKEKLDKKVDKEKLKNICQVQTELSKLEIDLESLQEEEMKEYEAKQEVPPHNNN